MPVDPGYGERLARRVSSLYATAELTLLRRIANALAQGIEAPEWASVKLAQLDLLRARIGQELDAVTEQAVGEVRAVIGQAFQAGQALAVADLDTIDLEQRLPPARAAAVERLAAETLQVVRPVGPRLLRATQDIYQQVVAEASANVVLGAQTRREAAQHALDRLTRSGVRGFRDSAGRNWTAETYTEMAVRTGTGQAAIQGHVDQLQANGLDLIVVSDSPRECKVCRPWEGKVLSLSGGVVGTIERESLTDGRMVRVKVAGTLDEARSDGLFHPNCRHSTSAYLPGATRLPTKTADTDARVAEEQRQRYLERQVRAWKTREATALDDTTARAARAKVRAYQARIRSHLDATDGLTRKSAREQVGRAR
ncbi:phage minor capsid protein [Georgenia faecalis]|uniref:phage minor capsid protein n=1 Tax=Georgenia faecalis TaxID=2483799 RepID=UPI000FDB7E86|nr:phage minor capsid protein [Georgenia faecalis]